MIHKNLFSVNSHYTGARAIATVAIMGMFGRGKVWQISVCLLTLFISQDIVKIWMVKVIRQSFPLPKIHAIGSYMLYATI